MGNKRDEHQRSRDAANAKDAPFFDAVSYDEPYIRKLFLCPNCHEKFIEINRGSSGEVKCRNCDLKWSLQIFSSQEGCYNEFIKQYRSNPALKGTVFYYEI